MRSPVTRFAVENYAGYRSLEWAELDPKINLLVGQPGVGKSLLLEGLIVALNYLAGQHSRDLLARSHREFVFEIQFAEDPKAHRFSGQDLGNLQGGRSTGWTCEILHVVENRQPKNSMGSEGPPHRRNPIMRYADASARLKTMLTSTDPEKRSIADEVFVLLSGLPGAAFATDWGWIRDQLMRRGKTEFRPSSCGQYDVLAIVLDLVVFRRQAVNSVAQYVILDNPETYLHPACLRPLLNLLRGQLPEAQFFIATHSTRLLTYAQPKNVFWLPSNARGVPTFRLEGIRTLPQGARAAFLNLYGEDVDPGLFSLLGELESPEAHRFLADCALECRAVARSSPARDSQLTLVAQALPEGPFTLLDYGAGYGDLLSNLASADRVGPDLLYVALDPTPRQVLNQFVKDLKGRRLLHPDSRVIRKLSEAPTDCHAITLLNVAHHLTIPEYAEGLSTLFASHLAHLRGARLFISELRTLAEGERNFLLWDAEDMMAVLAGVPGISIGRRAHEGHHAFEAIDATIVERLTDGPESMPSAAELEERFWRRVPEKRNRLLDELQRLRADTAQDGLERRWRQHRVAFLCAQIAWFDAAERARVLTDEGQRGRPTLRSADGSREILPATWRGNAAPPDAPGGSPCMKTGWPTSPGASSVS